MVSDGVVIEITTLSLLDCKAMLLVKTLVNTISVARKTPALFLRIIQGAYL